MRIDLEAESLWKTEAGVPPKCRGQEEGGQPAEEAKKELAVWLR